MPKTNRRDYFSGVDLRKQAAPGFPAFRFYAFRFSAQRLRESRPQPSLYHRLAQGLVTE
jgi:hypothetical protein